MQRRLTVALVGIALAAVVLVGAGVLFLAQFGARSQTEAELDERLVAATDVLADAELVTVLRSVDRLQQALQLESLRLIVVDDDGDVRIIEPVERGPRSRGAVLRSPADGLTLDADQYALYREGLTVTVTARRSGARVGEVVGLRMIETSGAFDGAFTRALDGTPGPGAGEGTGGGGRGSGVGPAGLDGDVTFGLLATKSVVTVGRDARLWFASSAAAVLALSVAVAWLLARRFTRPLQAIEAVTASVAAGDFSPRVQIYGDDELATLGRSVNRMAADLERSKALDQQFLMSVSHDLRTPLTVIAGYAEALSDGATDDPARAGQIIANHATRLERLVGDLLDLARLDANRFQFHSRPLDLAVVVGRTVAGLTPRAERYGLALGYDAPGTVPAVADPDRLAQIVGNLIDNALKFARSQIMVTVGTDGTRAVLAVSDDGPGIPATDLPHVFERLYVSSAQPARAENPSGMGLAIVRELVAAMGGTVEAETGATDGTTFTVTLPLRP